MDEKKTEEKKSFWKWSQMSTKKKAVLITVLVLVLCWGWGGYGRMIYAWYFMQNSANGYQGNAAAAAAVAVKDFESLGMVFASVDAKRGENVDIYGLLLKEAQKLGADGIINVYTSGQRQSRFSWNMTLTGSALAIKYTESIGVPAVSTTSMPLMQRWFGHGRNWGWR